MKLAACMLLALSPPIPPLADKQQSSPAGRPPGRPRLHPHLAALEGKLLDIICRDRVAGWMSIFQMEEEMPIESGMLTHSLKGAEKKI